MESASIRPAGTPPKQYWQTQELIVIGVFSALIKISSLLIAIAGGGMNPLSLVLKNIVATMLLIVLLYKVRKFGVLSLYVIISSAVSMLLNSGRIMLLPGLFMAGFLADGIIKLFGGFRKNNTAIIIGVALFDILSRCISMGISFLTFRENPSALIPIAIIIIIGYVGCLLGLGSGVLFTKELKHAGIIRS